MNEQNTENSEKSILQLRQALRKNLEGCRSGNNK